MNWKIWKKNLHSILEETKFKEPVPSDYSDLSVQTLQHIITLNPTSDITLQDLQKAHCDACTDEIMVGDKNET